MSAGGVNGIKCSGDLHCLCPSLAAVGPTFYECCFWEIFFPVWREFSCLSLCLEHRKRMDAQRGTGVGKGAAAHKLQRLSCGAGTGRGRLWRRKRGRWGNHSEIHSRFHWCCWCCWCCCCWWRGARSGAKPDFQLFRKSLAGGLRSWEAEGWVIGCWGFSQLWGRYRSRWPFRLLWSLPAGHWFDGLARRFHNSKPESRLNKYQSPVHSSQYTHLLACWRTSYRKIFTHSARGVQHTKQTGHTSYTSV